MITIAHADWSVNPDKQWIAVAHGPDRDNLTLSTPQRIPSGGHLLQRLSDGNKTRVFIGFDFPIGVPLAYARRLGVTTFRQLLETAGRGKLSRFFEPAGTAGEISLLRPFYPDRPGGTARSHLTDGLGVGSYNDLLRLCDRATNQRGAASALFWTLGAQQAGKAAISGWSKVLQPAISDPDSDMAIWPFDGDLLDLLARRQIVVTETYPAQAAISLGLGPPGQGWSKRSAKDRISKADSITGFVRRIGATPEPEFLKDIEDGFGTDKYAEDRFDATLGLLLMISVVKGLAPPGTPSTGDVRKIEGWILGQKTC